MRNQQLVAHAEHELESFDCQRLDNKHLVMGHVIGARSPKLYSAF